MEGKRKGGRGSELMTDKGREERSGREMEKKEDRKEDGKKGEVKRGNV